MTPAGLLAAVDALAAQVAYLREEVAVLVLADGPPVPRAQDCPDLAPGWAAPVIPLRKESQR